MSHYFNNGRRTPSMDAAYMNPPGDGERRRYRSGLTYAIAKLRAHNPDAYTADQLREAAVFIVGTLNPAAEDLAQAQAVLADLRTAPLAESDPMNYAEHALFGYKPDQE